jgi:hypothetical protein
MSEAAVAKWDQSEFDATLQLYLRETSRTLRDAVNTKGFYVARGAVRNTLKASRSRIQAELGKNVSTVHSISGGKIYYKRTTELTSSSQHDAPLAALIINKRLGRSHKSGLYGRDMSRAIRQLLGARQRSVAFIASGWIPAIKKLAPAVPSRDRSGAPAMDGTPYTGTTTKGDATLAADSNLMVVTIENRVTSKHDPKHAIERIGSAGLQVAFDHEAASMQEYIARKLEEPTARFNAKNK